MKKLITITSLLLITVLTLTLVACSSYGKIEKALNDIGYNAKKTTENSTVQKMFDESGVNATVHYFDNRDTANKYAVCTIAVLEFDSTDDLITLCEKSTSLSIFLSLIEPDLTGEDLYNALVETGYANGNCLVICLSFAAAGVRDAVKNA